MKYTEAGAIIILLIVAWSLYNAHRDKGSTFNLFDLLMEGGKLSRLACVFMGAWFANTWILVRLTEDGRMTEGYLTAYGLTWVAPIIAKLFAPPLPPSITTTETSTKTEVSTPKGKK